ncbi:RNA polymerase sigma factor [Paenibacillus marinisediminis]
MGEEEEWVARLRRGEPEGLRPLMDAYGDDVLRTAALLLRDRHQAEDISQEVFLTVYRKINQLKDPTRLKSWVMLITINRCRAWMRRSSWRRLFYREQVENGEREEMTGEEAAVMRMDMSSYLQELPYKYREVIVLHYYRDWSIANIAEALGEAEGTVKSKLSRARKQLEAILEERGWNV